MDARNPGLTRLEVKAFTCILRKLKCENPNGTKNTSVVSALHAAPKLLNKYLEHQKNFKLTTQERWAIFRGDLGLCENPGCASLAPWRRTKYQRFCSKKCAGPNTSAGRKATCLEKYGVEYVSQVPAVQKKMSIALRATHAAKGNTAPRKGRFEYVPQPVRPNTGSAFYVYLLLDPRKPGPFYYGRWKFDYEPFYVGKGKGGRAFDHLRNFDLMRSSNLHKKNKIGAIVKEDLEPLIVIKRIDLEEASAFELEARLIHTIGCGKLGPLTNVMRVKTGGTAGFTHTRATRAALSKSTEESWARHTEGQRQDRCSAISRSKRKFSASEYLVQLKTLFKGRISATLPADEDFRMGTRLPHVCKCGHARNVSPHYILSSKIGCPKCIRNEEGLAEQRRLRTIASKAQKTLPMYLQHLRDTYKGRINVRCDKATFTMSSELMHVCHKGHTWAIRPHLFMRYQNGCPHCMTHTNRTAKAV